MIARFTLGIIAALCIYGSHASYDFNTALKRSQSESNFAKHGASHPSGTRQEIRTRQTAQQSTFNWIRQYSKKYPQIFEALVVNSKIAPISRYSRNNRRPSAVYEFQQNNMIDSVIQEHTQSPLARILLHNFANALFPGGGCHYFCGTQEEMLTYGTTLLASLLSPGAQKYYYHHNRNHPHFFSEAPGILSSNVCVLMDGHLNVLNNPFFISVYSSAAADRQKNKNGSIKKRIALIKDPHKKGGLKKVYNKREADLFTPQQLHTYTLDLIRNLINSAIQNGSDTLVLGAFGCGAFHNDPKEMASCFHQILVDEGLDTYFKKIIFAIPDKEKLGIFQRIIQPNTMQPKKMHKRPTKQPNKQSVPLSMTQQSDSDNDVDISKFDHEENYDLFLTDEDSSLIDNILDQAEKVADNAEEIWNNHQRKICTAAAIVTIGYALKKLV